MPGKTRPGKEKKEQGLKGLIRDIAIAGGIVAMFLIVLYAYAGVWPPMVVIESNSMMHGSDSRIGVIDTGDLTLVKKVDDHSDVVTYVQAASPKDPNHGFQTYGDNGNVIIYRKNGLSDTPVIHRAIAWIDYNASASDPARGIYRGDLPDIGVYNVSQYTVPGLKCWYTGHATNNTFTIHLSSIFSQMASYTTPHGGFVTHGDHNPEAVDQESLYVGHRLVQPVKAEWVVGMAEGELPWFGLLKLWVSGQSTDTFPESSVQGLVATIVLLVVVPILIDYGIAIYKERKKPPVKERHRGRRHRRRGGAKH